MLIIGTIMGVLLSYPCSQYSACDDFKELLKVPPRSRYEYRGRYVNLTYEYSVLIPKGLTGYDGRDETNHEGFRLALGKRLRSLIFVRGEHNSLEYDTPREAAMGSVKFLRQQGKIIESEAISDASLSSLKAVHLIVNYTCPGSGDRRVLSSVIALSTGKRFIYELELYSRADRFEIDRRVQDQIIASWKMIHGSRLRLRK